MFRNVELLRGQDSDKATEREYVSLVGEWVRSCSSTMRVRGGRTVVEFGWQDTPNPLMRRRDGGDGLGGGGRLWSSLVGVGVLQSVNGVCDEGSGTRGLDFREMETRRAKPGHQRQLRRFELLARR